MKVRSIVEQTERKITRQLALSFAHSSRMRREDFIVTPANAYAVSMIDRWRLEGFAFDKGAVLVGEAGSGKTHLCSAWGEKMGGVYYMSGDGFASLSVEDVQMIDKPVVIDSKELWLEEEHFLHQYNALMENRIDLLMTARELPSKWNVTLPDLHSRMMSLAVGVISEIDDTLIKPLLQKLLKDKGIEMTNHLGDYVLQRIERKFSACIEFSVLLDRLSLEKGKRPGLADAREAFRRMYGTSPS